MMLAFLLGTFVFIVLFSFIMLFLFRKGKGGDDGPDGGILPWQRPPQLDLPPGISWPKDEPDTPVYQTELEEEMAL